MVNHLRHRLSKGGGSIVAEGHNASIRNLLEKEIFQLEYIRFRVCPGVNRIAAKSMHAHNTGAGMSNSASWQESGLVKRAYSIVGEVVAPFEGYTVTNAISSRQPAQDAQNTSTSSNLPHQGHGDESDSTLVV